MNKKLLAIVVLIFIGTVAYFYTINQNGKPNDLAQNEAGIVQTALAAKFDYLSQNGNSSCSASFRESIPSLPASERLQGSCCCQ